jgi:hypothetical protein
MKKTILSITLCLTAIAGSAQTTVKGVLVDQALGEGEPYATVRIIKEGAQKPAASFLTDVDGRFSHQVSGQGRYNIVFSSVGKQDLLQPIELTGKGTLNLDTLYIQEDATALQGVEIVAQKPLVKMEVDKMSYNVAEDDDAPASTVLDMLRKVPMVTVDGQDNISVNGSSSFKVYVDGKPNVMFSGNPSMIFKNMPAVAVKSIEVVTNPGAKYDAEGAGGVLNIVLNKQAMGGNAAASMNGYNGTLRAQVGTNGWGAGAFLSGQQGKLSYSANAMQSYMKPGTPKVAMEMEQAGMKQTSESRTTTKLPFTMGSLSLAYELDSVSILSLSAQLTSMNMKNTGRTETALAVGNGATAAIPFAYGNDIDMKNAQTSFTGSMDYQRFFNSDRTSWVAVAYQLSYSPNHNETRTNFDAVNGLPIDITDRFSDNHEKTVEHTFQTDYTTPLGAVVGGVAANTLNLGAKLMLRRATSDAKYYLADVYNQAMSMDYEHRNRIGAAYAEYEGKWGSVGAKAGLRYEHTWQDVEYHLGQTPDFTTDYGNLVPSASLSYALAPTKNVGLTYNMRISRPGITYLNPYVDRSNPTALTYGNSDLDVEKTHNVALVMNSFSTTLMMNLNLSHNFTDNAIEQYTFDDGKYLNTTYGNIVKRHLTALNGYVNWLVHKNSRLFMNAGVSYVDLRSNQLGYKNNGWQYNLLAGLQQTLPWQLKLGAYYSSQSKTYTLQGWSSGMNLILGNITKTFFNEKLTLGLQGLTCLNDGGCLKVETMSRGNGFVNHSDIRVPIYSISFTVSYAFGNTKQQFQQQHQTRIESDFIEQKSQGEMIQGAGSMGN